MKVLAYAPSNIALVKYMGKKDHALNLPENPSLSFTLNSLCTLVEASLVDTSCEKSGELAFEWVNEAPTEIQSRDAEHSANLDQKLGFETSHSRRWMVPALSEKAQSRMFNHLARVNELAREIAASTGLSHQTGKFLIRSSNTFPEASGIASSASSFAAMTLAGLGSFLKGDLRTLNQIIRDPIWAVKIASCSRVGSGSSCRSFQGPWVYWDHDETACLSSRLDFQMPRLAHFVVLISQSPKQVSSSLAHHLVRTSPLWEKRGERAKRRAEQLRDSLQKGDLKRVSQIAWDEMWEMHSLFHTSAQPFSYWEPETLRGLQWLKSYIDPQTDPHLDPLVFHPENPPIVTLDAGPNLHLLVEEAAREGWRERLKAGFPGHTILEDTQGSGARLLSIDPT